MKTFEEKWTAWIDDQLTGRELEEFLASLPNKTAAEAEKQSAKQVGSLLREQATALIDTGSSISGVALAVAESIGLVGLGSSCTPS